MYVKTLVDQKTTLVETEKIIQMEYFYDLLSEYDDMEINKTPIILSVDNIPQSSFETILEWAYLQTEEFLLPRDKLINTRTSIKSVLHPKAIAFFEKVLKKKNKDRFKYDYAALCVLLNSANLLNYESLHKCAINYIAYLMAHAIDSETLMKKITMCEETPDKSFEQEKLKILL